MAAAAEVEGQKVEGKKGVEAFVRARVALVQKQVGDLGGKVRGQVAGLRKTLEAVPQQTLARINGAWAGPRFEKVRAFLGRPPIADAFGVVHKQITQLKARVDGLTKGGAGVPAAAPTTSVTTTKE